jgi:amino acid adenylation domain-containing protein
VSESKRLTQHVHSFLDIDDSFTISMCFESVVERFPSRIAIHTSEQEITYDRLNKRANQIAHMLLDFSEGNHNRVGLLFEQGSNAIASILGVLKAGCAFVPLNDSDPVSVLIDICRDCTPVILLTDQKKLAQTIVNNNVPIIDINKLSDDLSETNPSPRGDADTTAYLFYTSGSTGKPKGVCQTQRNLFHFVRVYSRSLGLTYKDRLSLLYTLAFSASNMDVFGALLNGATLCPYNARKLGTTWLPDWLETFQISILHTVPTVFRHITKNLESKHVFSTIKGVDLGGESVFRSDIGLFKKHFTDDCILINHLAATEASVMAQYQIDLSLDHKSEFLPVGTEAEGVMIRFIDSDGNEVAEGETGEIEVHSPYVSSGYWNLPELNRKVFIEGEHLPKKRMYRSGDLGYRGEDGKIYFLGRSDHRVKIHGYSVDTNEVEAAIRKCSPWHDIAVIARQLEDDNPIRLVAFIVENNDTQIGLNEVRKSLSQHLASYKIPTKFVFLTTLPEIASGKIDRKSLEKLDLQGKYIETDFVAPVNEMEQKIADLYKHVLKIDQVGRNDDFFYMGGDSLKATELHVFVDKAFSQKIPLYILFRDPTVAGMASNIRKTRYSIKSWIVCKVSDAVGMSSNDIDTELPFTDYILNSVDAFNITKDLIEWLDVELPSSLLRIPATLEQVIDEIMVAVNQETLPNTPGKTDTGPVTIHKFQEGDGVPLFGLHAAGGMMFFRTFANNLDSNQSFYALQGKGLDTMNSSDFPFSDLYDLAGYYADEIIRIQPIGPYHICGRYGTVVLETGQQLLQRGKEVALTIIFDNVGPRMPDKAARRVSITRFAASLYRGIKNFSSSGALLNSGSGKDTKINEDGIVLSAKTINNKLSANYVPELYPRKIVLIRSVGFHNKSSKARHLSSWRALTGDLDVHVVAGTHRTMWVEPHVRDLVQRVQKLIDES